MRYEVSSSARDTGGLISEQDIEVVRAGYDALNRRDHEAWIRTLHSDVELHELPTSPDAAVFQGHDEVRKWIKSVFEVGAEGSRFEPQHFAEFGPFTLVSVRALIFARGSAVPVEAPLFHVIEVVDGKARRIWGFLSEAEARDQIDRLQHEPQERGPGDVSAK